VKDTAIKRLGESGRLQFRAEVFNILNHANFSIPRNAVLAGVQNVEAPLSIAGVINSTANKPRQVKFALKLLFQVRSPVGVGQSVSSWRPFPWMPFTPKGHHL
jgi:hypothetical protein